MHPQWSRPNETKLWGRNRSGPSVCSHQAGGLLRGQVAGRFRADILLEAANGVPGQPTENAIHMPLIVTQSVQRFLDLPSLGFGHSGFSGHRDRRRGCRRGGG